MHVNQLGLNIMFALITIIVITALVLGHKIARYFNV